MIRKSFLKRVKEAFVLAPVADKLLFLYAFTWSLFVRFCIFTLPFKFYRNLLGKQQVETLIDVKETDLAMAKHIRNIVLAVCRHTPWKSKCLVEALVCKRMLKKKGIETTIYLGVSKDPQKNKLKAHAWLKLGAIILTGAQGHKEYKVVNFYG
jgi:hypothetical protein